MEFDVHPNVPYHLRAAWNDAWDIFKEVARENPSVRAILEEPTLQVHFNVGRFTGPEGALTSYHLTDGRNTADCASDLRQALRTVPNPQTIRIEVTFRSSQYEYSGGYVEVLQLLAHEIALHCIPVLPYVARILGSDPLTVAHWPALAATGDLSERWQHKCFVIGSNLSYPDIIGDIERELRKRGKGADADTLLQFYENDRQGLERRVG